MSVVTAMVVVCQFNEDEATTRMNAWCWENDSAREQYFKKLDGTAAGGVKVFTGEIWAMAGNFFPWEQLAEAFPDFGWRYPEEAVLIVNYEDRERVLIFRADRTTEA